MRTQNRFKMIFSIALLFSLYLVQVGIEGNGQPEILPSTRLQTDDIFSLSLNGNLTLNIEFIGFTESLINETGIEEDLFDLYVDSFTVPLENTYFDFEFNYVNETQTNALQSYIESIAINGTGTGYTLDIEQLKEDYVTGERSDIFIPCDGMSIDANQVTEYINNNIYTEPPADKPGYTIYLMNFSNFDTVDHSLEHWYDTYGTDLDSNLTVDYWYSGYTNIEKRAAMGYGSDYRFCYLDVSSRSWYLDYVYTAWGSLGGHGYQLYYQYPDLDNLTQTFDPATPQGKEKITQYLSEWINTYVGNVFSKPVFDDLPTGQSVSLQVKVFNNLTDNGYPENTLTWCISKHRILDQLEDNFPWVDWDIQVEWVELDDYPNLFNYLESQITTNHQTGGKFIEVSNGLFDYLEGDLGDHFNFEAAEEVLPCYFFLTNEVSFTWYGVSFAGLGGMGWEILLGTQNSIFENGTIGEYRRGMSDVMIHELGHSLGLPHPHGYTYGWGSSFLADTMSYFSTYSGFSVFNKDAIGGAHTEANFYYALEDYPGALEAYWNNGHPDELNATIEFINNTLQTIPGLYRAMDYESSAELVFDVRDAIQSIFDFIDSPPTTENTGYSGLLVTLVIVPIIYTIKNRKKKKQ